MSGCCWACGLDRPLLELQALQQKDHAAYSAVTPFICFSLAKLTHVLCKSLISARQSSLQPNSLYFCVTWESSSIPRDMPNTPLSLHTPAPFTLYEAWILVFMDSSHSRFIPFTFCRMRHPLHVFLPHVRPDTPSFHHPPSFMSPPSLLLAQPSFLLFSFFPILFPFWIPHGPFFHLGHRRGERFPRSF